MNASLTKYIITFFRIYKEIRSYILIHYHHQLAAITAKKGKFNCTRTRMAECGEYVTLMLTINVK